MLTIAKLNKLKAQDKPYRVYDSEGVSGFYVEVSPKLTIAFRFKYTLDNKEYKISLGKYPHLSLGEAREIATEMKALVSRGIDPRLHRKEQAEMKQLEAQQALNFTAVIDIYIQKESVQHKGHRWNQIRLEKIKRDFPKLCQQALVNIKPIDLIAWRDERLLQVSSASVNRELNLLSSIFSYAIKELRLIEKNPIHDIKKPAKSKPRVRRISAEEIELICSACNYEQGTTPQNKTQMVAWSFLFAIETAMRASEIAQMEWRHVHTDYVHLPDTKNGTSRDVALLPSAIELLALMRGIDEYRVVPLDAASMSTLFRKARDRTVLKESNLHFHDARHEACTRLAQILPIQDLAKVSGHKDLKILLNTYYNITASEIATKMRKNL